MDPSTVGQSVTFTATVSSVVATGTVQAAGYVGDDSVCGDGLPVVAHRVPLDDLEAEFGGRAEDFRAAGAVGWAEIVDRGAEDVFEGLVAGAELFADCAGGEEA